MVLLLGGGTAFWCEPLITWFYVKTAEIHIVCSGRLILKQFAVINHQTWEYSWIDSFSACDALECEQQSELADSQWLDCLRLESYNLSITVNSLTVCFSNIFFCCSLAWVSTVRLSLHSYGTNDDNTIWSVRYVFLHLCFCWFCFSSTYFHLASFLKRKIHSAQCVRCVHVWNDLQPLIHIEHDSCCLDTISFHRYTYDWWTENKNGVSERAVRHKATNRGKKKKKL